VRHFRGARAVAAGAFHRGRHRDHDRDRDPDHDPDRDPDPDPDRDPDHDRGHDHDPDRDHDHDRDRDPDHDPDPDRDRACSRPMRATAAFTGAPTQCLGRHRHRPTRKFLAPPVRSGAVGDWPRRPRRRR
jgi:hypothetical protein